LSDRQAADAVRGRIDWKYALALELTDPGFDFSVLCEFRARLVAGGLEQTLLDAMLTRYRERGVLKVRGRQRTDSTHVLAAVRRLNRLENMGETLRTALNALAATAPDWLVQHAEGGWLDRYGRRVEDYRLPPAAIPPAAQVEPWLPPPKSEAARRQLGESIGADGHRLLAAVYDPAAPKGLRELPAVQTLRRTWVQQFYLEEDKVSWRGRADLPPSRTRIHSPYNVDAGFGDKRSTNWIGYKTHVTETCDAGAPHVIINVATTPAPVPDTAMMAPVHTALAGKDLLPQTHFVDAGYVDADLLLDTKAEHGVELISPIRPDSSWQAKAGQGYDVSAFAIDWNAQVVTCPQGHKSINWLPGVDDWGTKRVQAVFAERVCRECPSRSLCTRTTSHHAG
jgi:transposase